MTRPSTGSGLRSAQRVASAAVLIVVTLGLISSCTQRTWRTSDIDAEASKKPVEYPATKVGVVDSLTARLSERETNLSRWAPSEADARCVAERLVGRISADRLLEIGYDTKRPSLHLKYSPSERVVAINVVVGCVKFADAILSMFSAYNKLPVSKANCMADGFKRLGLDRNLATAVVDGAEPAVSVEDHAFASSVAQLADECLEATDLAPGDVVAPLPKGKILNPSTTIADTVPDSMSGIQPGGPLDTEPR